MKTSDIAKTMTAALAITLCAACAHQGIRQNAQAETAPVAEPAPTLAPPPVEAANLEPSLREAVMRSIAELKAVHFEYAKDTLTAGTRAVLRANADWLQANDNVRIQVAGNCDQRGTTEYNLALGQRRAQAVRNYYIMLGIAANRIATISYGKERPACAESTESCWRENRRADSLEAVFETVSNTGLPSTPR